MLIINRKDGESIERMLKRYKNKHRKTKLIREIRKRKHFTRPSIKRRHELLKAKYINEKYGEK